MTLSPLVILILLLFLLVVALLFLFWAFLTMRTGRLVPEAPVKAQGLKPRAEQTPQHKPQKDPEVQPQPQAQNGAPTPKVKPKKPSSSKEQLKDRLSNDHTRGLNASSSALFIPAPSTPPVEATITKKHSPQVPRVVATEKQSKPEQARLEQVTPFPTTQKPEAIPEIPPQVAPLLAQKPLIQDPESQLPLEPTPIHPATQVPPQATPSTQPKSSVQQTPQQPQPEQVQPALRKPPKFTVVETNVAQPARAEDELDEEQIALFDNLPAPPAEPKQVEPKQAEPKQTEPKKETSSEYTEDAFDRFIKSKNDDLNF